MQKFRSSSGAVAEGVMRPVCAVLGIGDNTAPVLGRTGLVTCAARGAARPAACGAGRHVAPTTTARVGVSGVGSTMVP
ncbi:hypothetical protein GCM10010972_00470 [Cellulomonas carbonis]|nr:hypothetical protein GCM10010972_00470 [Cellulomonas carbonis]